MNTKNPWGFGYFFLSCLPFVLAALFLVAIEEAVRWNTGREVAVAVAKIEAKKDAQIRERDAKTASLEKENLELKQETSEWRMASYAVHSIYRNELSYMNLSEDYLLHDFKPKDLAFALHHCMWMIPDDVCKDYSDKDSAPILISVFSRQEAKLRK